MRSYNEQCDKVLTYLNDKSKVTLDSFTTDTGISRGDAIIVFLLERKGFIELSAEHIRISSLGRSFITQTSFVSQRQSTSK